MRTRQIQACGVLHGEVTGEIVCNSDDDLFLLS
jgi:hypothetical protein